MRLITMGTLLAVSALACAADGGAGGAANGDSSETRRAEMVTTQIEARGVDHPCVLEAMRRVPREHFVPAPLENDAYRDGPLSIGRGQTISQPYIVALMTALTEPEPTMRVLEIGTGSGYQAAVLAECVADVYTIEIIPELGRQAAERLEGLSYTNIHPRVGDGFDGWPEEAPFDAIVVTAAPSEIPQPLLDQLAVGGRLVIPVGRGSQDLVVVTRTEEGYVDRVETPVRFVPMTGKAEQ
jgi:protein-L-isoaspartate(D-aspartate) O-methyltransferase